MRRKQYPVSRYYLRSVGSCRMFRSTYLLLKTSFQLLIGSASKVANSLGAGRRLEGMRQIHTHLESGEAKGLGVAFFLLARAYAK